MAFRRALLRSTLEVAIPWGLGHVVVYGLVRAGNEGSLPTWLTVTTAAAYAPPLVHVISLFVRSGRTPYDRVARTAVTRARTSI